jgi:CzcA family heavy metal efflux pump
MGNFFKDNKSAISVLIVLILISGVVLISKIKSGLFPDITFPKVKIIAENGDVPIDYMMPTVTIPIENAIKKVEELSLIHSTTSRGSCEISAYFNWDTNIELGKQRVEAAINSIKNNLPNSINISVEKMNPSILPIMGFSVEGSSHNNIELKQISEYIIKPFFSRIKGVAEVNIIGGSTKEYQIIYDPFKLSLYKLTPKYIESIVSQSNLITSNGFVKDYNRLYLSVINGNINNKEDIENICIKNTAEGALKIKDVAEVKIKEQKEYIKIKANGKNVPLVAIIKQPGANLIEVVDSIKAQLPNLSGILPKDIVLKQYYNQAEFVQDSIRSLEDVLWIGLLLAIIVTILFLKSFKASSVILVTIPITLSLTIVVLYYFNYTLNIMTIGAIAAAIGLIIDDAIVVVEQIHRTHEENPSASTYDLVPKAINYLLPAMVGSSLSTIVIFLPFGLMGGVAGAYFKVLTNTMIITLVSSFIVTWLALPVIYLLFFGKDKNIIKKNKEVKSARWVIYFINRPIYSILFISMLIVFSAIILPYLPSGFLPEMDEGAIVLDFSSPPGTSLEDTDKMLEHVDLILSETKEVNSFSRRLGTQMGFFITEQNRGDYLIELKKNRNRTTEEVADEIRNKIEMSLPALKVDFGQVIGDMLGDLMSSVQPIEIKLFGDDKTKLYELSDKITEIIKNTRGTADGFNGITIAGPEVQVIPNFDNLSKNQINAEDLQYQLQTKLEGVVIGSILESNRLVNIRLFELNENISIKKITESSFLLPNGELKPIKEFMHTKILPGVAEVDRENLKQMVSITARLNNRDLGSTLAEIKSKINSEISLPIGFQITYGGSYAEQQQAFNDLLLILILAAFLVFTVILFLFRRILVSLAIIFISVLGVSGSLLAILLTGIPLNVGSYTGLIMIIGIIGENSIFTFAQYITAKKSGLSIDEAIAYSISTRIRPKLMTAIGAITALFPLALGIGTGAQLHQPLAISIIGGFVLIIPLLLIVLPTLIKIVENFSKNK